MGTAPEFGTDVMAVGAALAGFILVYLGAVSTGFATFDAMDQPAVLNTFQRRARFAFGGIFLCLLSILIAFIARLTANNDALDLSIGLIFCSTVWSGVIAFLAVLDVK